MQVFLELSNHPKANVKRVALGGRTVIGRSQACNLRVASASVSRRHCELRIGDDGVAVVDLGSSNGTFVDGDRLPAGEERPVPPGGTLGVGGVTFVVRYQPPRRADEPGSTIDYAAAAAAAPAALGPMAGEPGGDTFDGSGAETVPVPVRMTGADADEELPTFELLADDSEADAEESPAGVASPEDDAEPIVAESDDVFLLDDEDEILLTDEEPLAADDAVGAEEAPVAAAEDSTGEDDAFDFLTAEPDRTPRGTRASADKGQMDDFFKNLDRE